MFLSRNQRNARPTREVIVSSIIIMILFLLLTAGITTFMFSDSVLNVIHAPVNLMEHYLGLMFVKSMAVFSLIGMYTLLAIIGMTIA
jgi:surface polysaccharide O-acyltransferase-like enzyme